MSEQPSRPISEAGLRLIIHSEGFEPLPRPCPAGKPTVGHGHVVRPGESFPRALSREEAQELLRRDLETAREAVTRLARVPLDDGQFAALTSFVFNVGEGALAGSTLLRRLNAGDYAGAASEFPRWDKITVIDQATGAKRKQALPGLTARRLAEMRMFLGGTDQAGV